MRFKKHHSELIVIALSFFLGVIPIIYKHQFEGLSYLIWSIGIIVSVGMFTLRIELKENFERFTSIYASLSNISISGLFSVGKEVIRECEEKLSQLAKGEILGHIESMRYVNERFEKAKNSVITTHPVRDISNLSCWLSPDFINWMKKNKKSEVVFTRFFILDNEVFKNSGDCEKLVLTLKNNKKVE